MQVAAFNVLFLFVARFGFLCEMRLSTFALLSFRVCFYRVSRLSLQVCSGFSRSFVVQFAFPVCREISCQGLVWRKRFVDFLLADFADCLLIAAAAAALRRPVGVGSASGRRRSCQCRRRCRYLCCSVALAVVQSIIKVIR